MENSKNSTMVLSDVTLGGGDISIIREERNDTSAIHRGCQNNGPAIDHRYKGPSKISFKSRRYSVIIAIFRNDRLHFFCKVP